MSGRIVRSVVPWRELSLDAKVVGGLAFGNWLLLIANHTVVQVTRDAPLWQLFPGLWGAVWMLACGAVALAYPLRDHGLGGRFTGRDRALHLAAIVALFVIVPAVAEIVLRATGKPYTYVHDGAIMVEEAARKLLGGQDPYATDYLDTPLFYWPMINNPALYHFTYFPLLFLVTAPFVALFDHFRVFFDERYLYLPAYVATLMIVPLLIPGQAKPISARAGDVAGELPSRTRERGEHTEVQRRGQAQGSPERRAGEKAAPPAGASPGRALIAARLSLVAIIGLDPQLFPFVAEGRNDFFVLAFVFGGIVLLQRRRTSLAVVLVAVAASLKLHAGVLLPFLAAYLIWQDRRSLRRAARAMWAGAAVLALAFAPFLVWDLGAFLDDVVAYNAGGAAWSYPISGMGFSALLRALGVISFPQQDFPFWAFQLAAASAIAFASLRWLRREPEVPVLLAAYAGTLLAFLFFGRYFQGNYLGYIAAVAAPVPFLRPDLAPRVSRALAWRGLRPREPVVAAGNALLAPVTITAETGEAAGE